MELFAVIDTETNWSDQVMSIGTVLARVSDFTPVAARYQILTPEYLTGGMYSATLFDEGPVQPQLCSREQALQQLDSWLRAQKVRHLFAYNASFDYNHLPELRHYCWHDIMRLAAYRQTNPAIAPDADCYATGRLKRGYGVEAVLRMLRRDGEYHESHNALSDALDELQILKLLTHPLTAYPPLNATGK